MTDEPEIILAAALASAGAPDAEYRKQTRRHAAHVFASGDEWLPLLRRFAEEILVLRVDVADSRRVAHADDERMRELFTAVRRPARGPGPAPLVALRSAQARRRADPARATPVPCRGWQGFWTLPDDVAVRVEEQLR